MLSFLLGAILGVELPGPWESVGFDLCISLCPRVPLAPRPRQYLVLLVFLVAAILVSIKWYLVVPNLHNLHFPID